MSLALYSPKENDLKEVIKTEKEVLSTNYIHSNIIYMFIVISVKNYTVSSFALFPGSGSVQLLNLRKVK